jgi:flagellar basal-body rod protein FlgB
MKLDFFHDQTIEAAGAYLSRLSQRQQIIASNLANIDTPGYKTRDVSFHATMQELLSESSIPLRTSRPEHNAGQIPVYPQAEAFEVTGLTSRADRNNVDLDREMMKLSETAFGYSMMSQMLRSKFHTLASSINEGKDQ